MFTYSRPVSNGSVNAIFHWHADTQRDATNDIEKIRFVLIGNIIIACTIVHNPHAMLCQSQTKAVA